MAWLAISDLNSVFQLNKNTKKMAFKLKRLKAIALNIFKKLSNFYDVLSGTSDYGKFVVIGQERTGSNLLITLLQSHPKIKAYGGRFMRLGGKSCEEVRKEIFPQKSNMTIGFKLFYTHPLDSGDKSIWNTIEEDTTFRIIHLQRKNLLRAHISKLVALKTDVWINSGERIPLEARSVHVDVEIMLADLDRVSKLIKETRSKFKNHKTIEVAYEDIIGRREETINRILSFLGVNQMRLQSRLKKINTEKLKDIVLNFEELKKSLEGTEYASMLDD